MRNLSIRVLFILFLITSCLFAQESVYIGMTADEFKTKYPGMLPDTVIFNGDLYLHENLNGIEGRWTFGFYGNKLGTADFQGESTIKSEDDFNKWIESAKSIINGYTGRHGQPLKQVHGSNTYLDRSNPEYKKTIGKREVFEEAFWKSRTSEIKISCDYRSNYYEEFKEGTLNGPDEWYSYNFQINYSYIPVILNESFDERGRFYPGMNVRDFAKEFPELFPGGIGMSGQWLREQDLYGLKGKWAYTFKNGKLDWIHYDKYINEINDTNFNKCIFAAKQLIKDYSAAYGNPDTTITGNTNFIDPYVNHHWGYDVLEARWKNYRGMKIKIEFTFMGGKGEYHFLVKINYFDKDYPYYD